jgi:hypothetical protein
MMMNLPLAGLEVDWDQADMNRDEPPDFRVLGGDLTLCYREPPHAS